MIDIRKLKELVRLMVENDLSELNLQDQQETVTVKRGLGGAPTAHAAPAAGNPSGASAPMTSAKAGSSASPGATASSDANTSAAAADKAASDAGLVAIVSPMVGTYYGSPNPEAAAFITVGKQVTTDTTVCLVEAMKVFNEIKAETTGTIERVLVQSGQSVEYGQKLFLVRPI